MKKYSFTKKQASEALNIPAGTIEFYTDEELVIPAVANPSGRGKTRRYSRKNLLEILLIKHLTFNYPLAIVKKIMDKAREGALAKKLDPEGQWSQNNRAKLVIFGARSGNIKLRMEGEDRIWVNMELYDEDVHIVNIERLYVLIDKI
jgi:DNA-binding transcriptional MerR regulator